MHAALLDHPAPRTVAPRPVTERYAKVVEASKRIRWDLERDVFRGRVLDFQRRFMPDGLSKVGELAFLKPAETRFFSQVQGRTYANLFAAFERCIGASTLALSRDYWLGDQVALEALVRFTDEELKHQTMFRRLEAMAAEGMPSGYAFLAQPDEVAAAVLAKSTWAVLALTLDVEVVTQAHYRASIECDTQLSDLWKDVLLHHWKEESQHTILDELEWRREHARCDEAARARGVDDLIGLFGAVDSLLQAQSRADAAYFIRHAGRMYLSAEETAIRDVMLKAYRWQHIVVGVQEPRYLEVLRALTTPAQMERIARALEPILAHVAT
ncbi:MAG TPA: hypothetical protein VII68_15925 [Casimicrobiaceae bacterium]|jgi:hypothetical protein